MDIAAQTECQVHDDSVTVCKVGNSDMIYKPVNTVNPDGEYDNDIAIGCDFCGQLWQDMDSIYECENCLRETGDDVGLCWDCYFLKGVRCKHTQAMQYHKLYS